MSLLANRWFYLKTSRWYVGVTDKTDSNFAGESSIGLAGFTRSPDPFIELTIPKGTTNILQEINTGKKLEGFIEVPDWNAVKQLIYTDDVVSGGATEPAIDGTSRNTIGYFALVGKPIQIVNTTDDRTVPDSTYVFTNALIRDVVHRQWNLPNSPQIVRFYADSVTETVA